MATLFSTMCWWWQLCTLCHVWVSLQLLYQVPSGVWHCFLIDLTLLLLSNPLAVIPLMYQCFAVKILTSHNWLLYLFTKICVTAQAAIFRWHLESNWHNQLCNILCFDDFIYFVRPLFERNDLRVCAWTLKHRLTLFVFDVLLSCKLYSTCSIGSYLLRVSDIGDLTTTCDNTKALYSAVLGNDKVSLVSGSPQQITKVIYKTTCWAAGPLQLFGLHVKPYSRSTSGPLWPHSHPTLTPKSFCHKFRGPTFCGLRTLYLRIWKSGVTKPSKSRRGV